MEYQFYVKRTYQHLVAVPEGTDLDDVSVLYVDNFISFDGLEIDEQSSDVWVSGEVLNAAVDLDRLEGPWSGEGYAAALKNALEDWPEEEAPLLILLEQEATFGWTIESPTSLSVSEAQEAWNWDVDFEVEPEDCMILDSLLITEEPASLIETTD